MVSLAHALPVIAESAAVALHHRRRLARFLVGWGLRLPETETEAGICFAPQTLVEVDLVSFTSTRRARVDSKTFSKVLHLAMLHGWTPERLTGQPPSASWDTEIILPDVEPYFFGSVSNPDAEGLTAGLKRMLDSEALCLPLPAHFAAISILAVAENGSFGVVTESAAGQTGGSPIVARHGGTNARNAQRPTVKGK